MRLTGSLFHAYRDTLATVRNAQGLPDEALRLLDPDRVLPVRRKTTGRRHLVFQAKAHVLRGEKLAARHTLDSALSDRRILPSTRSDPAFAELADLFKQADESFFFDELFSHQDDG